jgi:hypothetical protein
MSEQEEDRGLRDEKEYLIFSCEEVKILCFPVFWIDWLKYLNI